MHLFLKKENISIIVKDIGTVALSMFDLVLTLSELDLILSEMCTVRCLVRLKWRQSLL